MRQILDKGVYVAPTEMLTSRQIVVRATSRIFPDAFDEAVLTVVPVVGESHPELWVMANPANRRFVEVYASVGDDPLVAVEIQVGGQALATTAVGVPVYAHRATFLADPLSEFVTISAEVDGVLLTRTIQF